MARRRRFFFPICLLLSLIIFTAASLVLLVGSLVEESEAVLETAPDIVVTNRMMGRPALIPSEPAAEIAGIPGVRLARPRVWGYYADPYSGAAFTLLGIDPASGTEFREIGIALKDGTVWKSGERGKIIVGDRVPSALHLDGRNHITLEDASGRLIPFTITGFFSTASSLLTADLILMDEADVREFFHLPAGLSTDIAVAVPNLSEIPTVAAKIRQRFPAFRVLLKSQIRQNYAAVFNHRAGILLYAWSGCIAVFLMLLRHRGVHLPPLEQMEIGILKATGWGSADILEMKLLEALVLCGSAFSIGFSAAYVHVYIFKAVLFRPFLFGWSVVYPEFALIPAVTPESVALLLVLTVIPYTAASVYPAWKFAVMESMDLIKGGAP